MREIKEFLGTRGLGGTRSDSSSSVNFCFSDHSEEFGPQSSPSLISNEHPGSSLKPKDRLRERSE